MCAASAPGSGGNGTTDGPYANSGSCERGGLGGAGPDERGNVDGAEPDQAREDVGECSTLFLIAYRA